ncbi:hypothetical protein RFI_16492 [Reticulomyxa filosa]|uniref:Uncharacterized protein n=1 Tax=Reticulomyxa filosa TaxID=46433 RepID=X6N371_RETFI|nr:hypothetical protein RFI_16492 [Reticulomyxa filosa]|eukprot:ETO20725.1 hypothetical protein RFI_16492 [Reticulomyxa filosa]
MYLSGFAVSLFPIIYIGKHFQFFITIFFSVTGLFLTNKSLAEEVAKTSEGMESTPEKISKDVGKKTHWAERIPLCDGRVQGKVKEGSARKQRLDDKSSTNGHKKERLWATERKPAPHANNEEKTTNGEQALDKSYQHLMHEHNDDLREVFLDLVQSKALKNRQIISMVHHGGVLSTVLYSFQEKEYLFSVKQNFQTNQGTNELIH